MRLYPESDSTACEDEKNRHLLLGGMSEVEVPDDDDDTAKEGAPPIPDFSWRDQDMTTYMTDALDQMRKHKHFCDVVLQINKQDFFAHRAVLAASSPYLMDLFNDELAQPTLNEVAGNNVIVYQLNGGFQKDALEKLIDYAYTARLDVRADQVKSVYLAATRLRMDRVAHECAAFLSAHIDLRSCLEIRALPGVVRSKDLVARVDAFIDEHMEELVTLRPIMQIDRVCVEVLHASRQELDCASARALCQLVLDWIHSQWLEDERLTLDALKSKNHLLYLGSDNTLEDCEEIEEGSANDSEIVQDYKKSNQQIPKQAKKVRRHSAMKPAKPRELLYSRHINQEDPKTEDNLEDWKVISCTSIEGVSILSLITIDGHLFTCSIIQRVNNSRSNSPPAFIPADQAAAQAAVAATAATAPATLSRPSSQDKDVFEPLATMNQAKCVGTGCLDGKLVVCGGFDRGECLNSVSAYDLSTNSWEEMEPMLTKRGRFDVCVVGRTLYAVGGSSGQHETHTAERYDSDSCKWSYVASLPAPISNIGLCSLDGTVYCIGGTYGQSGNKYCYKLVDDDARWERIASLQVGRSQAAVTSFLGRIWVVGGCDAWKPLSTVEIYDPVTNSWRQGPPMNSARRGCGLVSRNGLLYVVGGSDGTRSLCTTEVFDPRLNLWTAGPNMTTCRVNVSASLVEDKIWAVGGFSGKFFLNTMEYLDPDRDEWTTYITNESAVTTLSNEDKPKDESETVDEKDFSVAVSQPKRASTNGVVRVVESQRDSSDEEVGTVSSVCSD